MERVGVKNVWLRLTKSRELFSDDWWLVPSYKTTKGAFFVVIYKTHCLINKKLISVNQGVVIYLFICASISLNLTYFVRICVLSIMWNAQGSSSNNKKDVFNVYLYVFVFLYLCITVCIFCLRGRHKAASARQKPDPKPPSTITHPRF